MGGGEAGRGDRGVSQMFMTMDVKRVGGSLEEMDRTVEGILASVKRTGGNVRYPGEGALRMRRESMAATGCRCDGELWGEILKLSEAV